MTTRKITITVCSICFLIALFSQCKKKDAARVTNTCNNIIVLPTADSTAFALPTAFTPNGDGVNDIYYPIAPYPNKISNYSLSIYNASTNALEFQTNSVTTRWDGTVNGTVTTVYKHQVHVSFTDANGVAVDTCSFLFLVPVSSAGCINPIPADTASYIFPDEMNFLTGVKIGGTNERYCN